MVLRKNHLQTPGSQTSCLQKCKKVNLLLKPKSVFHALGLETAAISVSTVTLKVYLSYLEVTHILKVTGLQIDTLAFSAEDATVTWEKHTVPHLKPVLSVHIPFSDPKNTQAWLINNKEVNTITCHNKELNNTVLNERRSTGGGWILPNSKKGKANPRYKNQSVGAKDEGHKWQEETFWGNGNIL